MVLSLRSVGRKHEHLKFTLRENVHLFCRLRAWLLVEHIAALGKKHEHLVVYYYGSDALW